MSSFHEGEMEMQRRAGAREDAEAVSRMIGDEIMRPALPWLAQQTTFAVAASAPDDSVWCSTWLTAPGFATSVDGTRLVMHATRARWSPDDPVAPLLVPGARAGMLAIDLATRRRLRINGAVAWRGDDLELVVEEAFPNCPKYIHKRRLPAVGELGAATATARGTALHVDQVSRVDTMFVGSRHPMRGLDASHRGGEPGFVRLVDPHTLRIPDYPGNNMFQTLGNVVVDPRAGAALLDLERWRMLCVTGVASVIHGVEDPAQPTGGTARYWQLAVERWVELPLPT